MKTGWTIEWARKPIAGRYAISDRIPPSLAGSHAFRTFDRRIPGIVTQARTGHGYFGKYYQTHIIQEPADCPCGAGLQAHEHRVSECRMHEEYADIIDEGAPDHQLASLFGTKTGIDALAEFVKKSVRVLVILNYYSSIIFISVNRSCTLSGPFAIFGFYLIHHPYLVHRPSFAT